MPRIEISPNWLYQKYIIENLSTREIAQILGVSKQPINTRLRELGLLRPPVERGTKRETPWMKGERHPLWKGGVKTNNNGVYIRLPDGTYKKLARVLIEQHIGRLLTPKEVVHHINGNKLDNRLENLQLLPSQKEHAQIHVKELNFKRWKYVSN